jgi:hypothetical protein
VTIHPAPLQHLDHAPPGPRQRPHHQTRTRNPLDPRLAARKTPRQAARPVEGDGAAVIPQPAATRRPGLTKGTAIDVTAGRSDNRSETPRSPPPRPAAKDPTSDHQGEANTDADDRPAETSVDRGGEMLGNRSLPPRRTGDEIIGKGRNYQKVRRFCTVIPLQDLTQCLEWRLETTSSWPVWVPHT